MNNLIFTLLLKVFTLSLVLFMWYLYAISEGEPEHLVILYMAIAFSLIELRSTFKDLQDLFGWIGKKLIRNKE